MKYFKVSLLCIILVLFFIACDDEEAPTTPTQTNTPPVATFTVSAAKGNCPFKVTFDASGSRDPGNALTSQSRNSQSINSYHWDFGDGNSKRGQTVNHFYRSGGIFTATLTVTDNDGSETRSSKNITVRALTGGWKGWLDWDGYDVELKLYLLQQDRDLTGIVIWKYEGQTIYHDEITGRYKLDDAIDMMWVDIRRRFVAVIIEAEPNAIFNRIDGRMYEAGFAGQIFIIKKVSDEQVIPASFDELIVKDFGMISGGNRTELLRQLTRKLH